MDVFEAYRQCERVTRERARNFYYGIRLLPPAKRSALCAVYALARRVDDIGDGQLPDGEKLAQLATVRAGLGSLAGDPSEAEGDDDDPVLVALSHATRHFPIPLTAFGELVDGVELDVRGTTYPTFDELAHYCRCVAGSIGRLSLGVFGSADPPEADRLADALGLAMQLTNILRDLREDAAAGRVYLPAEDLARFGWDPLGDFTGGLPLGRRRPSDAVAGASLLSPPDPRRWEPDERLTGLISFQAARAQRYFSEGLGLVPMLDRRSAACVMAMAGIYQRLLDRITRRPELVLRQRVSLHAWEKAEIAVRSLTRMPA
ncbi:MAG TPA: squalene/phytoene synthase family protein [Actinomycetota bacterium]